MMDWVQKLQLVLFDLLFIKQIKLKKELNTMDFVQYSKMIIIDENEDLIWLILNYLNPALDICPLILVH